MGLTHPDWKKHLTLAVQIQKNMLGIDSGLPRAIDLRRQRFNEHATPAPSWWRWVPAATP